MIEDVSKSNLHVHDPSEQDMLNLDLSEAESLEEEENLDSVHYSAEKKDKQSSQSIPV